MIFSSNTYTRRRQLLSLIGLGGSITLILGVFALTLRAPQRLRLNSGGSAPQILREGQSLRGFRRVSTLQMRGRPTAVEYLNNDRMVIALMDEGVRSWLEFRSVEGRVLERTVEVGRAPIYSLHVAPSGKELVFATDRPEGKLYRLNLTNYQSQVLATARNTSSPWCRAAYSPDSKTLALLQGYDYVTLLDTATLQELGRIPLQRELTPTPQDCAVSVAFSPDGQELALGGVISLPERTGVVQLWNLATKRLTQTYQGCGINALGFSSDGQFLASRNDYGGGEVHERQSGRIVQRLRAEEDSASRITHPASRGGTLRFVPGTSKIIMAGDGEATATDARLGGSQAILHTSTMPMGLARYYGDSHAACSPNGQSLVLHNHQQLFIFKREKREM